jgi:serine/threonine protein phosphatase PrpC
MTRIKRLPPNGRSSRPSSSRTRAPGSQDRPLIQAGPAVRSAGDSHIGKVRTINQDVLLLEPGLGLYAVLDGMGGHSAGEVASQLACDGIRNFMHHHPCTALTARALLEAAIRTASSEVFNEGQRHFDRHGMGTTVVACLVIDGRRATIAHVGDSRAYLWRNGELQPLTRDHTMVQELVEMGRLSAAAAEKHPYRNMLTRHLGAKAEIQIDCVDLELQPRDRLLLCSDGLYGYASAEAIQGLLGSGKTPEHAVRDLIELALQGGGGDNVSALVIEALPPPRRPVMRDKRPR